jgi:hypothetical protein
MTTTAQFLAHIDAFLERSGMAAAPFGKAAVGDPSFVRDLRNGRSPSLALVDRVNHFIAERDADSQRQGAA